MTDNERSLLESRILDLEHAVNGNGREGLKERMKNLETLVESQSQSIDKLIKSNLWGIRIIVTFLVFILGSIVNLYSHLIGV